MKIHNDDYELLRELVLQLISKNKAEHETNAQFVERYTNWLPTAWPTITNKEAALRGQLFHYAVRLPNKHDGQRFDGLTGFSGKLLSYLGDAQIDTALRKILASI